MAEEKNANKIIKKIPVNENGMVFYKNSNGNTYKITRNPTTNIFTIYKIVEDGFERLGKGNHPIALEEKYIK